VVESWLKRHIRASFLHVDMKKDEQHRIRIETILNRVEPHKGFVCKGSELRVEPVAGLAGKGFVTLKNFRCAFLKRPENRIFNWFRAKKRFSSGVVWSRP
jgi:hypothetical protein